MANVRVKRPIIGISMGDPFGNGPEITVSALSDASVYTRCRPLVVGDCTSLSYACRVAEKLGRTAPVLHRIESVEDALFTPGTIDVLDLGLVPESAIPDSLNEEAPKPFGVGASTLGGEAAFQYVKTVIELAMQRKIDATVTNAISKEAINMAGHHYSGHTEIYAHYTNTSKYTMMLAHDALRVVHVSTHVSLRGGIRPRQNAARARLHPHRKQRLQGPRHRNAEDCRRRTQPTLRRKWYVRRRGNQ